MALNRMMYCSTQEGYSANIGDGVMSQILDGGADRYRKSLKGVMHTVSSRWVVQESGYQYLMAFYRVWARNPSQPFLAKICVDNAPVEDYECFFSGAPSLSSKVADVYTVTATLKVRPLPINEAMDDLIVGVGNEDSDLAQTLPSLEKLVNKDLPDALETHNG
ncbi:hypothetical protein F993_01494 [Acinetobacter proteolyticus]|uniref:Bacteriophage protein n=1 Tax=Acinetobacter proteolyticus TaxID=1776741 RepID=A0ABP2TQ84_9GAMM|nr:hypothetical protein [Acinetobacter proteolyticus]ENU24178.1 hypothetical protein F993_01494 [Acinetobacter proteolyticus]